MCEDVIEIYGIPSIVLEVEEDFYYKIFHCGKILDFYKINDVFFESCSLSRSKILSIQDPKKLEILARSKDIDIKYSVASHPNMPKQVLEILCEEDGLMRGHIEISKVLIKHVV